MHPKYYKLWAERGLCANCGSRPRYRGIILCKRCDIKNKAHQAVYRAKTTEHRKQRNRKWYLATRAVRRAVIKKRNEEVKRKVFDAYGGACQCCGESELVFLALDHVNNDGASERRSQKTGTAVGRGLYLRLIREGFPNTFQILCANCNWAKYVMGRCPHERSIFSCSRTA